jgi:conjugal transfer pilus assembly protein TraE
MAGLIACEVRLKSLLQKSRLSVLVRQRNGYLVLASGLLLLSFILTLLCFYLSGRERIILVPPTITRSFWVSHNDVSPEYLSEMTTFFAYSRLNVTPESADSQRQLLLRYVDPRYYGTLNTLLIAERDRITSQHVSTAFYPVNIKVDVKTLSVLIIGDLVSTVGTAQVASQRVAYEVRYLCDQGRLLVSQFQEVKNP